MNRPNWDDRVSEALKRGTDDAARQKQRVWRAVSQKITKTDQMRNEKNMRRRRSFWLSMAAAATVAAAGLVYVSLTSDGTALGNRFSAWFQPAGSESPGVAASQPTATDDGAEAGNPVRLDPNQFQKETSGGAEVYRAVLPPDEDHPTEVVETSVVPGRSAEKQYQLLLSQATGQVEVVDKQTYVFAPAGGSAGFGFLGWSIRTHDRESDIYEGIFIMDDSHGGCFVIRLRPAEEDTNGYTSRLFDIMLALGAARDRILQAPQTTTPSPVSTATATAVRKLTWDDLAIHGVKLDTDGDAAIEALISAIGADPINDQTGEDVGGTTRTVKWASGTIATVRNGGLYSIEATDPAASVVGLHSGMTLDEFKSVLGEPHEAIDALAWGVGSNDNLIVAVRDGIVISIKVSLVE